MPNHQITWEAAQQMPDDGMRYEAIGGELIVTPAPNLRYQDIVLRLALQLQAILVDPAACRSRRVVSNARRGVAQYWIVDPEADAVEVHRFGEEPAFERFIERVPVRLGAAAADGLGEVDLETVFHRD